MATKAILVRGTIDLAPSPPDADVLALITSDGDALEPVMAAVVIKLRRRDPRTIADLLKAARGEAVGARAIDAAAQALAVETLAASRIPELETQLREVLFDLFDSRDDRLRFVAIGASGDLSRYGKAIVKWQIDSLRADPSERVRRAAAAFLAGISARERAAHNQGR